MAVLTDLPPDALLNLLNHIGSVSNSGQLLKLALACRQYYDQLAHADWFWQQQCASLGWVRSGVHHPPDAHPPAAAYTYTEHMPVNVSAQQAGVQQLAPTAAMGVAATTAAAESAKDFHASRLWFEYYCLRMSCRWRLRLLLRKYIPFLNIHSRLAVKAGASIPELEAAESALGMKLPWELWELYRYRAGQVPGVAVFFTDACRLLGLVELTVSSIAAPSGPSLAPEVPITQQQQLAAVEAQLPHLSCHQQAGATATAGVVGTAGYASSPGVDQGSNNASQHQPVGLQMSPGDIPVVVFLSNITESVGYVMAADSSVFLKRGFTSRRVANNLTGFIQHLLA